MTTANVIRLKRSPSETLQNRGGDTEDIEAKQSQ
jgi:hypothetical protein